MKPHVDEYLERHKLGKLFEACAVCSYSATLQPVSLAPKQAQACAGNDSSFTSEQARGALQVSG